MLRKKEKDGKEKVPIIQIGCRFQDEQMIIGSELFFSIYFFLFRSLAIQKQSGDRLRG